MSKSHASCAVCASVHMECIVGCPGRKTQGRMQPMTQECRAGNQGRGQVIKGRKLHLILTARQVTHLLVVTEVWDGECKGQVIQERKPHPMLVVCQLKDVLGSAR